MTAADVLLLALSVAAIVLGATASRTPEEVESAVLPVKAGALGSDPRANEGETP